MEVRTVAAKVRRARRCDFGIEKKRSRDVRVNTFDMFVSCVRIAFMTHSSLGCSLALFVMNPVRRLFPPASTYMAAAAAVAAGKKPNTSISGPIICGTSCLVDQTGTMKQALRGLGRSPPSHDPPPVTHGALLSQRVSSGRALLLNEGFSAFPCPIPGGR